MQCNEFFPCPASRHDAIRCSPHPISCFTNVAQPLYSNRDALGGPVLIGPQQCAQAPVGAASGRGRSTAQGLRFSASVTEFNRTSLFTMATLEGAEQASQPPNEGTNPFPPDRPGKRALWELLANRYRQGATVSTLAEDPRLQEVSSRPTSGFSQHSALTTYSCYRAGRSCKVRHGRQPATSVAGDRQRQC